MLKDEKKLWNEYKINKNKKAREKLIELYVPVVKKIVSSMAISSFENVDKMDLTSAGFVGLIEAVDNFEIDKGVEFLTYAYRRIKGAIFDYLRKTDVVSRSLREKEKKIRQASDLLFEKLKREPEAEEIAKECGMSLDEYYSVMGQIESLTVLSYNSLIPGSNFEHISSFSKYEDFQKDLEEEELLDIVKKQIKSLPEKEMLVVILYYYEKLNLKEIGKVLGVGESRVSQIRSSALQRLRRAIRQVYENK